jgi:hypothetical protein
VLPIDRAAQNHNYGWSIDKEQQKYFTIGLSPDFEDEKYFIEVVNSSEGQDHDSTTTDQWSTGLGGPGFHKKPAQPMDNAIGP